MPDGPTRRPRHPDKDLERLLKEAERQGWRIGRGKGYYKMRCPCQDKHMKTVRLTPSDPRYETNLRGWLRRSTCWREEER